MFPVKAREDLPVSKVVINSVAVRGQLGPMTIWVSNRPEEEAEATAAAANGNNNNTGNQANAAQQEQAQPAQGRAQVQQAQPARAQAQAQGRRRQYEFPLRRRNWTKVYDAKHNSSRRHYDEMDFSSSPIVLRPGEVRAIYIHSASPGDEGVVYDNSTIHPHRWHGQQLPLRQRNGRPMRATPRYQDGILAIHSARAHLSPTPFGRTPIWGWGNAWRLVFC